jgi:hypothetical protein
MKPPKLAALKIDRQGTKNLRTKLRKTKNIKITIHVDAGNLGSLSTMTARKLPAYYRLIGQLLKKKLDDHAASRLDRVERELRKLKRQIAA